MNILLSLLFLLFAAGAAAKDDSTERVVREIPQAQMTVRVQYYSPGIVRVKKWPSSLAKEPEKGSFSVILKPDAKALSRQISVESGIGHTMLTNSIATVGMRSSFATKTAVRATLCSPSLRGIWIAVSTIHASTVSKMKNAPMGSRLTAPSL